MSNEYPWENFKDDELLQLRICDLGLKITGSWLEEQIALFRSELRNKNLSLDPAIYLGDEWFSPAGITAISIPFYLAHPRLTALEKKQMLEVEGGTPEWCQRLLRHEAGHCFDHAFEFSKTRRWIKLFGSPDREYAPENYRPKPYSRSYVHHLDNWYAQAHPDEDFAETFAVWMTPDRDWKKEYGKWPIALAKLSYIEEQARDTGNRPQLQINSRLPCSAGRLQTTLEKYYSKRRKEHAENYPDFYDEDLRRIFNGSQDLPKRESQACNFMKKNQKRIIETVSFWTGERKFTIQSLVKKLQHRCESLDLRLSQTETETSMDVSAYLATLVTHYLFTGKFKRTV